MMATCLDDSLCEQGLELIIALLRGGNGEVQATIYQLLTDSSEAAAIRPFDGTSGRFLGMMKYRLEVGMKEVHALATGH